MVYLQEIFYYGDERKTSKYNKTKYETKEKIPRLVAPPGLQNGGRLSSGVRKHRKQAGPTLDEWRILV